jgi:carbamoyl-phosphate synthase large subunit
MNHPLTVLMTCGSGPGAIGHINALRQNRFAPARVIIGDVSPDGNAGFLLADGRVALPLANEPDLIDRLAALCRTNRIDVLWPVFDGELEPLAGSRQRFESEGIKLLLADQGTVQLCLDKHTFHEHLVETGLALPFRCVRSTDDLRIAAKEFGYPDRCVAIKPNRGAGGRGFHILDARCEHTDGFFSEKPDSTRCTLETAAAAVRKRGEDNTSPLLVTPFVDGPEYGCDALADAGRVIAAVTREKLPPIREGMHTRIVVGEDPDVLYVVDRLVSELRADGLLSVDLRADDQGRLWVLEVNPRAGAYLGMACERIDLLGMALARLFGMRPGAADYRRSFDRIVGLRYWADMILADGATLEVQARGSGFSLP